jgi:dCMP deaminase
MIKDKTFMEIAQTVAKESYCKRRQVGAIIVKDNSIISVGYNGTPSGHENNCEDEEEFMDRDYSVKKRLVTKPEVLHAESNAITKCAKSNLSTDNADLFVTLSPCLECSKLIIQSGIKRVVYFEEYKDKKGLELMKKSGIIVQKI